MKRLAMSLPACTQILSLLIHVAWADGKLEAKEKESVRAATKVLSLTLQQREELESALAQSVPLESIKLDALSQKDRPFAYVAAAWLARVDDEVDAKEEEALEQVAKLLGIEDEQKKILADLAGTILEEQRGKGNWADHLLLLFKAIPSKLEGEPIELSIE